MAKNRKCYQCNSELFVAPMPNEHQRTTGLEGEEFCPNCDFPDSYIDPNDYDDSELEAECERFEKSQEKDWAAIEKQYCG